MDIMCRELIIKHFTTTTHEGVPHISPVRVNTLGSRQQRQVINYIHVLAYYCQTENMQHVVEFLCKELNIKHFTRTEYTHGVQTINPFRVNTLGSRQQRKVINYIHVHVYAPTELQTNIRQVKDVKCR